MNTELRCQIYKLLIAVAAAVVLGRILSANLMYEPYLHRNETDAQDGRRVWPKARPQPTPMFSSNDRSRWATVRALVEEGTYVIGRRDVIDPETKKYQDRGIIFEDGWGSVDKVMDPETGQFYSSKPTLFPTLLAGEYWLLRNQLGLSITEHIFTVVRTILLTINWLPLIIYWLLLARLVERFGTTDWGKFYVVAAGCFGTFLTTFATTLNNHTVAACTAMYALYVAVRIWSPAGNDAETQRHGDAEKQTEPVAVSPGRRVPVSDFALAGFFAALTAAFELPAMSFLVGLFVLLLWHAPRPTLIGFVPPVLVVVAASLLTNYLAIGRLTPAYAELGKKSEWYMYEGSHWKEVPGKEKTGIDYAWKKEGRATYMFHFLFGHHGVFLLSPIFLLSMVGLVATLRRWASGRREPPEESTGELAPSARGSRPPLAEYWVAGLTAYLTVVVVGFYLVMTNNYGGWTCGPRWVFWLTPFWLLAMLPVVDRLSAHWGGRVLAVVLLVVAVASASFPAWNPWRHPWLYQLLETHGWISY